jgi:hypothetical protein
VFDRALVAHRQRRFITEINDPRLGAGHKPAEPRRPPHEPSDLPNDAGRLCTRRPPLALSIRQTQWVAGFWGTIKAAGDAPGDGSVAAEKTRPMRASVLTILKPTAYIAGYTRAALPLAASEVPRFSRRGTGGEIRFGECLFRVAARPCVERPQVGNPT